MSCIVGYCTNRDPLRTGKGRLQLGKRKNKNEIFSPARWEERPEKEEDCYDNETARNLKKIMSSYFRENGIVPRSSPRSGQKKRPCVPPRRAVPLFRSPFPGRRPRLLTHPFGEGER